MDLNDNSAYFGSYVPMEARSHPLLKHRVCMCSKATWLSKGAKAIIGGDCAQQASTLFDDQ